MRQKLYFFVNKNEKNNNENSQQRCNTTKTHGKKVMKKIEAILIFKMSIYEPKFVSNLFITGRYSNEGFSKGKKILGQNVCL